MPDGSHEHQLGFAAVNTVLTAALVLRPPDNQKEHMLVVDASGTGIGAVLLQDGYPHALDGRKLTMSTCGLPQSRRCSLWCITSTSGVHIHMSNTALWVRTTSPTPGSTLICTCTLSGA